MTNERFELLPAARSHGLLASRGYGVRKEPC